MKYGDYFYFRHKDLPKNIIKTAKFAFFHIKYTLKYIFSYKICPKMHVFI
jgi:hypothetical protein